MMNPYESDIADLKLPIMNLILANAPSKITRQSGQEFRPCNIEQIQPARAKNGYKL